LILKSPNAQTCLTSRTKAAMAPTGETKAEITSDLTAAVVVEVMEAEVATKIAAMETAVEVVAMVAIEAMTTTEATAEEEEIEMAAGVTSAEVTATTTAATTMVEAGEASRTIATSPRAAINKRMIMVVAQLASHPTRAISDLKQAHLPEALL
jgi:hypothetical protein